MVIHQDNWKWFILCFIFLSVIFTDITTYSRPYEQSIVIEEMDTIYRDSISITVPMISLKATYYHATKNQCDSEPDVTASGLRISKNKHIPVVAVSRDMLKRWGGDMNYGDTLYVVNSDYKHKLKKYYIIHDTMNKRYKNRVDILTNKTKFGTHIIEFRHVKKQDRLNP